LGATPYSILHTPHSTFFQERKKKTNPPLPLPPNKDEFF